MAKAKHNNKKSKLPKQSHIKTNGKQRDVSESRAQLDALGLKIVEVTADGNCFFRTLADQLEGNEEEHEKYRSMVVQFILKNREMFEPFIEDEVPFEKYCQSMGEDGTWAGHMELQAASLVTHSNICIHRLKSPRWYIRNFEDSKAKMIHFSYHDGEHYNSVRLKEDSCTGPARPISIKADADLPATSRQAKVVVAKSKRGRANNYIHEAPDNMIMAVSGCENAEKAEQVLRVMEGDVDAAVQYMIAEQGSEAYLFESEKDHNPAVNSHEAIENGSCENHKELKDHSPEPEPSCSGESTHANKTVKLVEKNISRNKNCPCGSKKKYKSCCGTVTARSFAKFVNNETVDHGKTRKGKQPKKGGGPATAANSYASEGRSLDVGALCI